MVYLVSASCLLGDIWDLSRTWPPICEALLCSHNKPAENSLRGGTTLRRVRLDLKALANQRDRTLHLSPWVLSSGLFAPFQVSQMGNSVSDVFEGLYIRAELSSLSLAPRRRQLCRLCTGIGNGGFCPHVSVALGKSLVLCVTSEWENSTRPVGLTKLQGSKEIRLKGKHFWKGTAQCRWSDFVCLSRNSALPS